LEAVFIKLLNMSITASWIVLTVIVIRVLLSRSPKNICCILWALVGVKLICPFSFKSVFSLIPSNEIVPENLLYSSMTNTNQPITETTFHGFEASVDSVSNVFSFASIIWIIGTLAVITYGVISYLRLKRVTAASINLRDNIWLCDDIKSPFIIGFFHPRIFVPSDIATDQLVHIEAHERAHIERLDQLWKPMGYAILSVHWFNPVIWLAYAIFCRDIEFACDERVIRKLDMASKRDYSRALLSCSIPHHSIPVPSLAFGEVGVKERVKSVLNYKKPKFWLVIAAVVICIAVGVCFLANPINTKIDSETEAYLHTVILNYGNSEPRENVFACEDHIILEADKEGDVTTIYAIVTYNEFSCIDGKLVIEYGYQSPSVITLDMTGNGYSYKYWEADDGTEYTTSIKDKFPWYIEDKAIRSFDYAKEQTNRCIKQAEDYFGVQYVDEEANTTRTTQAVSASN